MVREARSDDVDAVAALEESALGPDAWSRGLVHEGLTGALPTMRYLVAVERDEVIGYAAASVVADLSELQRVAVRPDRRRRGVATALLDAVVAEARGGGAERLLLEVRETNEAALALYAAHGFAPVDRRPRYYRDGATALVLLLALGRSGTGPETSVWTTR